MYNGAKATKIADMGRMSRYNLTFLSSMSQSTEEARWMFFSLHWCGCRDVLPQTERSESSLTHSARQPSPQAGRAPQLLWSLLTGMCMCLGRWTLHDLAAVSLCRWFSYHFITCYCSGIWGLYRCDTHRVLSWRSSFVFLTTLFFLDLK